MNTSLIVGEKRIQGLLLTNIPFQGGYSGAPLFNLHGDLIGIHTAFGISTGVGWSTPVDKTMIGDWMKELN